MRFESKTSQQVETNIDSKNFFIRVLDRFKLKFRINKELSTLDETVKDKTDVKSYFPSTKETTWDNNSEFFKFFKNGEFSKEERRKRMLTPKKGITLFRDIGLTFYKVKKGDTLSTIKNNLSTLSEFKYLLKLPRLKLKSFNIPAKKLQAGMWIPIPLKEKERVLTDEQFVNYAHSGLSEMENDSVYGSDVKNFLKKVSRNQIISLMLAIAKQESGGKPLGQFEFHRWEAHQKAFSFSLFHVLMKGAGIRARRKLGLTEGQLYHPKNASKLLIAFMIEKCNSESKTTDKFFPIEKNYKKFAAFYNGKRWKKTNPNYVKNLSKYYSDAENLIGVLEPDKNKNKLAIILEESKMVNDTSISKKHKKTVKKEHGKVPILIAKSKTKPSDKSEKVSLKGIHYEKIGNNRNLYRCILDSNMINSKKTNVRSILKSNTNARLFSNRIQQYLKKRYNSTTYYPADSIGVGIDSYGIKIIFKRKNRKATLRLRKA